MWGDVIDYRNRGVNGGVGVREETEWVGSGREGRKRGKGSRDGGGGKVLICERTKEEVVNYGGTQTKVRLYLVSRPLKWDNGRHSLLWYRTGSTYKYSRAVGHSIVRNDRSENFDTKSLTSVNGYRGSDRPPSQSRVWVQMY